MGKIRIAHVSDVHFRGLKRHAEYKRASQAMFEQMRAERVQAIFIGGDIVHSKVQNITPELIDILGWWFNSLAEIAPVVAMLGNHDGLIFNPNRLDTITPIVEGLKNERIFLQRDSGVYPMTLVDDEGAERLLHWCIFSPFDEASGGWDRLRAVPKNEDAIRIAGYHGTVESAITDSNWLLKSSVVTSFFSDFDFAMLGDIHRYQTLDVPGDCGYGRIVYSGSMIQQNFGETPSKGWVLWEIEDKENFSHELKVIPNDSPYLTAFWNGSPEATVKAAMNEWNLKSIPTSARVRLKAPTSISLVQTNRVKEIMSAKGHKGYFKRQAVAKEGSGSVSESVSEAANIDVGSATIDVQNPDTLMELYREWLAGGGTPPWEVKGDATNELDLKALTDEQRQTIDDAFARLRSPLEVVRQSSETATGVNWSIERVEWDNIFAYGEGNFIDFSNEEWGTILGVFGPNGVGKSTVVAVLMYALFNGTDRGAMSNGEVLNDRSDWCKARVYLRVGERRLRVTRRTDKVQRTSRGTGAIKESFKTSLELAEEIGGSWIEHTGEQRRDTDKILQEIIGGAEEFTIVSFAPQGGALEFVESGGSKRRAALMKLMNLSVLDEMAKLAKEASAEDRAWMKRGQSSSVLLEANNELAREKVSLLDEIESLSGEIEKTENELSGLKFAMTKGEFEKLEYQRRRVKSLTEELERQTKKKQRASETLKKYQTTLTEAMSALQGKNLSVLKNKEANITARLEEFGKMKSRLDNLKREITSNERQQRNLQDIPCGEQFPTCPYIKDAFAARDANDHLRRAIEEIGDIGDDKELQTSLKEVRNEISEFQAAKIRVGELEGRVDETLAEFTEVKDEVARLEGEVSSANETLQKMLDSDGDKHEQDNEIIKQHKALTAQLRELQETLLVAKTKVGVVEHKLEENRKAIENAQEIESRLLHWDSILSFLGPKGALQMILRRQLPVINALISKYLGDSVEFGARLHMEEDSKQLDVLLEWGDKSRGVETASGMQKLIAAIAIRAALHSITPLPKSDLLIMDEGFGALDPDSLEGAFEMFELYRRSYRRILLISHIDAVKEAVDVPLTVGVTNNNFSELCYEG